MMLKKIKCKRKECLQNEKGCCDAIIPTVIPKLKPNNPDCEFWEDEKLNKKLIKQLKNKQLKLFDDDLKQKKEEFKKKKFKKRKSKQTK